MTKEQGPAQRRLFHLLLEANRLRSVGDYRAALAAYLEVLELSGESAHLCRVTADCHFMMAAEPRGAAEHFAQAVTWMERAVALAPEEARLHADLGQYYSTAVLDYDLSAAEYREATRLNPNDVTALVGLTALYGVPEGVVTIDEVTGCMERAIRLEPDEAWYHARLAEFYLEAGRLADSKRECARALLCARPLDPAYAGFVESCLALGEGREELPWARGS